MLNKLCNNHQSENGIAQRLMNELFEEFIAETAKVLLFQFFLFHSTAGKLIEQVIKKRSFGSGL